MIIAPVIFLTIVTGIAGMRHLATVGRVFVKSMVYFLFFSTLALIIGLIVAHVIQPGAGMPSAWPIWTRRRSPAMWRSRTS
jgi:aerobic C4-dicarboxylate transport protein